MDYNFDQVIPRKNTDCIKWDGMGDQFGRDDLFPMWIADMDFACPDVILKAISRRLEHPILGYSFPPESCYDAIIDKAYSDYGWTIEKDWIVFTNGVVAGINNALSVFTKAGDNVIMQEPAYFSFFKVISNNSCVVSSNPLLPYGDGYIMDADNLAESFNSRTKLLIFCNPHNPTGKVWTKEEMAVLGDLCIKNKCIIISDEIHCDIVYAPHKHFPLAQINKDIAENTITFWAASKTYNIPGLSTAIAIIPNARLREQFLRSQIGGNQGNLFGYTALEAAYKDGKMYKDALLRYINENIDYFMKCISDFMPEMKITKPQGTYLLWADMRGLGMSYSELNDFLLNKCRIALSDGKIFGENYGGFQRFNLACPRSYVIEIVSRLAAGIKNISK